MAQTTIEWTATKLPDGTMAPGYTFNPWWGCTKLSEGCRNCYAEGQANRWSPGYWGPTADRRFFGDKHWMQPHKWNRKAARDGVRYKVFCGSMCDVFEDKKGLSNHRNRLGELIKWTPNLDWLLLTKRAKNLTYGMSQMGFLKPRTDNYGDLLIPDNVWVGVSIENQEQLWRVDELLKVNARVRFLSIEPLLGPIDLWRNSSGEVGSDGWDGKTTYIEGIDWVIVGGESGPNARPMHPDWARSLRDQCVEADVPFFFKQWGKYLPEYEDDPRGPLYNPVGKKAAGRLLDGREWNQMPEVQP